MQGKRVGGKLIEARYNLIRRLNLRGIVAGSIIKDYHKVADSVSPEQYVQDVVSGARFDSNLSKQLKKGFVVKNLIPNYHDDPRSCNWGVAIVWENPDYLPSRKIAGRVLPRRLPKQQPVRAAQPRLNATGR